MPHQAGYLSAQRLFIATTPSDISAASSPDYLTEYLSSADGLALTKAFMQITDPKLRRRIVDLVAQLSEGKP